MNEEAAADQFGVEYRVGAVVGTVAADGTPRKGGSALRAVAVDNGALRLPFLAEPGWGRCGIAYGPYQRANGLAIAVCALNGHNASATGPILQSLPRRLARWFLGAGVERSSYRFVALMRSTQRRHFWRKLRYWIRFSGFDRAGVDIDENFALGWFPEETVSGAPSAGNAFVMSSAGPDNGELQVLADGEKIPVCRGLQNVPFVYVIVLREQGAAYYLSSVRNARGAAEFPEMRPLAIDSSDTTYRNYAAIHQSVLGQIGFRVDTRVYSVCVNRVGAWSTWYGSAHAADRLTGSGGMRGRESETGQEWQLIAGDFEFTDRGCRPLQGNSLAVIVAEATSTGLLKLRFVVAQDVPHGEAAGLVWRYADSENYWFVTIGVTQSILGININGKPVQKATEAVGIEASDSANTLLVADDGRSMQVYLNGRRLFAQPVEDQRLAQHTAIGLLGGRSVNKCYFKDFEAHPQTVPIPKEFKLKEPWFQLGEKVVVRDEFSIPSGPLEGRSVATGTGVWRKDIGSGSFEVMESGGALVKASSATPNPGRTIYTLPWPDGAFGDLQVSITPPGTARGQGEEGRAGLVFWQDRGNYLIVANWLSNGYGGASVSTFLCTDGFEDLYDAVWTNVGGRITWGVEHAFRVVFDGMQFTALVNDEPVLYRSLTDIYPSCKPLRIARVGIVANWEWGNDTGSLFRAFTGRT